jgi:hypothetical protein
MARVLRPGGIRAWLGPAGVHRSGCRLVGLAPKLGLERFRRGMARGRAGVGRPVGRRVVRRDRRSPADRRTTADLHRAPADRRRTSRDLPTAHRSRPTTYGRPSRVGPAADRPAARRHTATADRRPAAACHCRGGGSTAHRLRAARLRALYRSSRPGLRDHRTRLVERRLHHRRGRGTRGGSSGRFFRPSRVWVRRGGGVPWSGAWAVSQGTSLGRALARGSRRPRFRRLARRRLWRLARRGLWRLARRWRRLA